MKPLDFYTKRQSARAQLAKAALAVADGAELEQATRVINKTAFSAPDALFWHGILAKPDSSVEREFNRGRAVWETISDSSHCAHPRAADT